MMVARLWRFSMSPVATASSLLPAFGEAEKHRLAALFRLWREGSGLGASDERQLAVLLRGLAMTRAVEILEEEAFLRLVAPLAGEVALSVEERRSLLRRVMPLLRTREMTREEKNELAALFHDPKNRMRLTSKLRRSMSAALESQFDPDDVLSEAYIRAETRWANRPKEPEKQFVWIYGIVQEQFYDMLRKARGQARRASPGGSLPGQLGRRDCPGDPPDPDRGLDARGAGGARVAVA